MSKAKRKRFDVYTFTVSKVFPPTSRLGIDILRLMAAYNDMSEIIAGWMGANLSLPKKPIASSKARMRMGIQHRLLMAFMHEALTVFDGMQGSEEFKRAEKLLNDSGQKALKNLRRASGSPDLIRSRIADARNTVIFHYDEEAFASAASRYGEIFKERDEAKSKIIVERGGRAYYFLPEHLRDIITFKFESEVKLDDIPAKVGGLIRKVTSLQRDLFEFLEELMRIYLDERGILAELHHEAIDE